MHFRQKQWHLPKEALVNYFKEPEDNGALEHRKGGERHVQKGPETAILQPAVSAGSFLGVLLASASVLPQDQPAAVANIPQSELGTPLSCPLLTLPLSPAGLLGPVAGPYLLVSWNQASLA